ncbi:DUF6344 domain-containing protein [Streptomyces sp. NPDC086783]|uniref:DUF6344 domain-containing protein n=1 Tax=Streptomyces sp. NPDC086783 TaxID=3365758 RepID=UPI003817E54E
MAQNKVMKLWIAIVTAFLAVCTTLGLITTVAAAAVPQAEAPRNTGTVVTVPTASPWAWSYSRSLPPTMKQRIRAEAHGSSPSCRHRATDDEAAADTDAPCDADSPAEAGAEPLTPLQR